MYLTGCMKERMSILATRYRLDLLPPIFPFHRRARRGLLAEGELVYYGPMPSYYGIGEILRVSDRYIVVDFRGTGQFGVHEDTLAPEYLIPIPPSSLQLL
jgi:hypothetical protein